MMIADSINVSLCRTWTSNICRILPKVKKMTECNPERDEYDFASSVTHSTGHNHDLYSAISHKVALSLSIYINGTYWTILKPKESPRK